MISLSADEARRIALRAQGLLGAPDRRAGVHGVLRHLGAVQLDTISVLARSHELVPYARLGAVGRQAVEAAYWTGAHSFEYWSHAACVLPIEEWPHFAFRRRAFRERGHRWHRMKDREGSCAAVRDRLRTEGPLTTAGLGGGRNGGEWWDWSESKIAVEWLLDIGEVVVTERRGWKRIYDLAERAVPATLFHDDLSDEECLRRLVAQAGTALGVATRADLADYHRLKGEQVDAVIADTGLVPVEVQGWPRRAWADPAALESTPRGRHRTTLLSPFDSLVWDRPRTGRIFGFTHRLEAYVPKPKRVHGYFAMPLLAGGRLCGRVDPAREGSTLVARQLSMDGARAVEPMARALREAAAWVGCDSVRVERCAPEDLRGPLDAELRELGV
ncbi:winged helix-turn-helix domain-containing protein [Streptomyces albus]|uniref:Winged helix-turn-helix domain-containing protein n=1 Tax=Streptomyces albus TaxID=1888 RepID=A0A6C1CB61_9ACTN|nr:MULTISPECIES: crosslink repair DNA glycosylase YcaQ family protein [Streptomyces]QID40113.1 winged helix-turn-helix domain-containing protein [Streptomyces albus]TGG77390.1 winged helix-turn-helix domain-containing protein [Streptomyces albus]UVN59192.1 winged helix DNA-binding domain-containing protein [Streptomyces albus]